MITSSWWLTMYTIRFFRYHLVIQTALQQYRKYHTKNLTVTSHIKTIILFRLSLLIQNLCKRDVPFFELGSFHYYFQGENYFQGKMLSLEYKVWPDHIKANNGQIQVSESIHIYHKTYG